jgi:FtsP/CotA-like multicopper oxidase with cupredoxin domain
MARTSSRRRILQYGVGAAAAGCCRRLAAAFPTTSSNPNAGRSVELPQPKFLRSHDKVLKVTLTAIQGIVDVGAPQLVDTYTYDGVVPGHTWEIHPGDTLMVDLVNKLPALVNPPHSEDMNRPHDWTTTNLHTHGLHVSPKGNADNVFLKVAPGETQSYEIPVPDDHPGGIFWYHPHKHGGVAQQVRGGMSGMIIVRGEIDHVKEVRAAKEQIMVLQALELGADYKLLDPIPNAGTDEAFFPRKQILYTVNGVLTPRITMYPGEVQRWRLLNTGQGKFMSLRLQDHKLHVLAWDGLNLAAPEAVELVMMSPGNRVEVLVKASQPGIYELVLTPGSSQVPDIPGMPDEIVKTPPANNQELQPRSIATIEVVGKGPEMGLPTSLPAYNPTIRPIAKARDVAYTVQRKEGGSHAHEFMSFGVDGFPFDPERAWYQMKLGTAERWRVINKLDPKLDRHAHVFHIHVNPFKITEINGKKLEKPLWRDTFVLTVKTGDSFTFESNFDDFTGKFVEHCHILSHEDLGMMEVLEIIP